MDIFPCKQSSLTAGNKANGFSLAEMLWSLMLVQDVQIGYGYTGKNIGSIITRQNSPIFNLPLYMDVSLELIIEL